jgi:5-hydroxyisourate hydrolase
VNEISTHVLDIALGRPAAGVEVILEQFNGKSWFVVGVQRTDSDGRCRQLLREAEGLTAGKYRLRFETTKYYESQSIASLYPFIEITFLVRESDLHLHIPLLLSANGYTTYRGI